MVVDNRLLKLLGANLLIVMILVVTATALSGYAENFREVQLSSEIKSLEDRVYALETMNPDSANASFYVYNAMPQISKVFYDLNDYYRQGLIGSSFYSSKDDQIVSDTVLYMKTLKQFVKNSTVVQFFCVYSNTSCDYESFVLSYLNNKYSNVFVLNFNGNSTHPYVRMVEEKYNVTSFPFILSGSTPIKGFKNADQLESLIVGNETNSS